MKDIETRCRDKQEIMEGLKQAVLDFEPDETVEMAKKAIDNGIDPSEAIEKGVGKALSIVGKKYEQGELFIIHLAAAGEAGSRAVNEVLKPEIERRGEKAPSRGKIVIGTVSGDIHEIGKTIVSAMLLANGFEVIDLGKDVPVDIFVEKVRDESPHILGLSALLSTTIPVQRDVIEALKKEGLRDRVKVMVGGAPVTEEWAKEIGADAYGTDAIDAVNKAKSLIGAN
jgi:corrinoid protein of di/trimethylamine methyltransferase